MILVHLLLGAHSGLFSFSEGIKVTLTTWRAKSLLEIVMGFGTKLMQAVGDWRINISL